MANGQWLIAYGVLTGLAGKVRYVQAGPCLPRNVRGITTETEPQVTLADFGRNSIARCNPRDYPGFLSLFHHESFHYPQNHGFRHGKRSHPPYSEHVFCIVHPPSSKSSQ